VCKYNIILPTVQSLTTPEPCVLDPISSECSSSAAIGLGVMLGLALILAIILGYLALRYWRRWKAMGGHKTQFYARKTPGKLPLFNICFLLQCIIFTSFIVLHY